MKEDIILKVTTKEAQLMIKALAKLPFEEVYELIGKINQQANSQFNGQDKSLLIDEEEDCECGGK